MNAPTVAQVVPRQRLTTDERQREIVAAVLALARERGPDAITTQAIADRIDVTQGALFRHFPDKVAIWLAVFVWIRESLGAAITAAGIAGVLLLGWFATSQGPLAPAKVTLAKVEQGPLVASTFGIGTVEARRSYALGPTSASRVARVLVNQGDAVKAGQLLAELDPVDRDGRTYEQAGEARAA